jgi:hypothetical protein
VPRRVSGGGDRVCIRAAGAQWGGQGTNSQKYFCRDFLYQILGSSDHSNEEFIKEFMNLVFEKAAREEIFCPLYAKLLSEISEKHPVILVEMNKLHENYLEIFKNIPGASNIASDPLGSLVGLTTNSVIDMFKAIEEKERERRPILKNINSVMAMGGKVDDMFNYLYEDILTNNLNSYASGGTIKIKPSKKGTFTKAAKSRGMGVQEFASKVLANKDNYSSAMVTFVSILQKTA